MQEDFLHYIWKFQKLNTIGLFSNSGDEITVLNPGLHNDLSGPDFFNSQIRIGGQLWAGNVEIHINSSDWYLHGHETDAAYKNVILHVVWNHDCEIFSTENHPIPTLSLKEVVNTDLFNKYEELIKRQPQFINCENNFASVPDFIVERWVERLFIERLERKSKDIENLLRDSQNNWEAVFFKSLAKNFGLNVNGDSFFSMSNSFEFGIIRKLLGNQLDLEALFYGQLRMFNNKPEGYEKSLQDEYRYIKKKFKLENEYVVPVKYFKLRPPNFPTIRLSQLASLYSDNPNLFAKVMEIENLADFYSIFGVATSKFWETHYTFSKESRPVKKVLTKSFIDLLLINTIIPIKFTYSKALGKYEHDQLISWAEQIVAENNSTVEKFQALRTFPNNSSTSQGLLQLKSCYCDLNRCLKCEIGNTLLKS